MKDTAEGTAAIRQIKAWLEQFVIELELCPFAAKPYQLDRIHFCTCHAFGTQQQLEALVEAINHLEQEDSVETSLLIFTDPSLDFDKYLDLLALANALIDTLGYKGIYQLASFHPDYQFEHTKKNDAGNFTNRAPLPILHLLREQSIENALRNYPHPEQIPQKNIKTMNQMGIDKLSTIMQILKEPLTNNSHEEPE